MRTKMRIKPKTHNYLISWNAIDSKNRVQIFGNSTYTLKHKLNENNLETIKVGLQEKYNIIDLIILNISEF